MNKKVGIIGVIVIVAIIAIIIICVTNSNSSSKFNEQFLEYEGAISYQQALDLVELCISNAEENQGNADKLPTIQIDQVIVYGGLAAESDFSTYVTTLEEALYEMESYASYLDEEELNEIQENSLVSFQYSDDGLIDTIIMED